MKIILAVILAAVLSGLSFAQNYIFSSEIGNFKNASSFCITSAGIIYVTDAGTDEVYKLDTLGTMLKYTGGYGWDQGLFDNPSDVFANPLQVYVCDKNNHRVEMFDKDLNYISQLYTRDGDNSGARFGYPMGCAVSQQGDLYVLDSENKRVVKFDMFGNYSLNFGGYDAGAYALSDPQKLAISPDNKIYVLDDKKIVVFDQYGNGSDIFPENDGLSGLNIVFSKMTVNNSSSVFLADLKSSAFKLNKLVVDGESKNTVIVASLIFNGKLYLLTPEKILIYTGS